LLCLTKKKCHCDDSVFTLFDTVEKDLSLKKWMHQGIKVLYLTW
jgi:hypothetical protein